MKTDEIRDWALKLVLGTAVAFATMLALRALVPELARGVFVAKGRAEIDLCTERAVELWQMDEDDARRSCVAKAHGLSAGREATP